VRKVKESTAEVTRRRRPALDPEARENQVIAAAYDLAEQQILNGTASSQVITHFLKLGSTKERIEKEILEKQKELITAKTEALQATKETKELFEKAIKQFAIYNGKGDPEDYYDQDLQ